jgi:hypothetical protein
VVKVQRVTPELAEQFKTWTARIPGRGKKEEKPVEDKKGDKKGKKK